MQDEIKKLIDQEADKRYPLIQYIDGRKEQIENGNRERKQGFNACATFLMSHLESRGWVSGEGVKVLTEDRDSWRRVAERLANEKSQQREVFASQIEFLSEKIIAKDKQLAELKEQVEYWEDFQKRLG